MFGSFIFDKDGVLMETEEARIRSYYIMLQKVIPHEIPKWKQYYAWHIKTLTGKSRSEVVEGIIQEYPLLNTTLLKTRESLKEKWKSGEYNNPKYKEVKKEIKKWLKNYDFDKLSPESLLSIQRLIIYADIPLEEKCKPIEHMVEFLRFLQKKKIPTSLITENELKRTKKELKHIGVDIDLFEIVVCKDKIYSAGQEHESPGKKSEMYSLVRKKFSDCVAIEDTRPGMQAASHGGVPCFLPCEKKFTEKVVSLLKALCFPNEERFSEPITVGIDFGGTHTTVGFGEILWLYFPRSFKEEDPEEIVHFLKKMCGFPMVHALGIGLATTFVPAQKKMERRVWEHSSKFKKLSTIKNGYFSEIQDVWTKEVGVPVIILNDGEAAALAEHRKGGGRGHNNIMVMTLGTSIGVGFIFHGVLHIGPYSSRASHIILDPHGEWDTGENHQGCWKTLAGRDAFYKLAEKMGLPSDPREITKKAQKGDRKAQSFYEIYAEGVARGIANIVRPVSLECVVIGGGIAQAGDVLFDPLRARLKKGDLLDNSIASVLRVVPGQCEEPVVVGAQLYAEEVVAD
jgi:predicted NBD/HSP70 family sugar kinase/beta-phosphoglucomutase-like phosphatase (HAD superfamily)